MRIELDTDGSAGGTIIKFNGDEQKKVSEFSLSIRAGNKVKIQMKKEMEGKTAFLSFYGDDLKKFDELK